MKTHTVKARDIKQEWHVIDAENKPLGRLAVEVARVLRGKHRPEYSPHLDLGDHVIVVNADKVYLSGKKIEQKQYTRYSGYPGGLKIARLQEMMKNDSTKVVRHAVKGMLPSTSLGRQLLKKLKVYSGSTHPHAAQTPKQLTLPS
jgi:large subunit ribosomal protein L13